MTSRIVLNKHDKAEACRLIMSRNTPFTLTIVKGKHRSVEQNRLQRLWLNEAATQLGEYTPEQYRGFCKLNFGCAILYHEDTEFAAAFDAVIRPLSYENKLRAMCIPLDMPVTRIMTTMQKKRYLDDVYQHFTELGVHLTDPNGGLWAA